MTRHFAAFGLVIWGALAAASCGTNNPPPTSPTTPVPNPAAPNAAGPAPTFAQVNSDILKVSCLQCHNGAGASGNIDLSSYAGVVAQVSPGNPSASALYNAVANGIMPPTGALPASQIQEIQAWIAAGALND